MRIGAYSNYPLELLKNRNDEEALKIAAKEFEAMFFKELMHSMRRTVDAINGGESNFMKSSYLDLFELEVSRALAERGIGIKDMILNKLKQDPVPFKEEQTMPIQEKTFDDCFGLPVKGAISSPYGLRLHPIYKNVRFHKGIDIVSPVGTPIYPIMPGRVILSVFDERLGNVVAIDHGNGIITKYAHNAINLVKTNDEVTPHMAIAKVGNTGITTGPHLHFEVIKNGLHVDPITFVKKMTYNLEKTKVKI